MLFHVKEAAMLVHEVMSTGIVTATENRYSSVGCGENDEPQLRRDSCD